MNRHMWRVSVLGERLGWSPLDFKIWKACLDAPRTHAAIVEYFGVDEEYIMTLHKDLDAHRFTHTDPGHRRLHTKEPWNLSDLFKQYSVPSRRLHEPGDHYSDIAGNTIHVMATTPDKGMIVWEHEQVPSLLDWTASTQVISGTFAEFDAAVKSMKRVAP